MPRTGKLVTYRGVDYNEDAVDLGGAEDVRGALDRIDGFHTTDLYVDGDNGLVLMIAGGPERFQVSIWDTVRDHGWAARDPAANPSVSVDLVLGGQGADLPMQETLDRSATEAAVLAFLVTNGPAPEVTWVEG